MICYHGTTDKATYDLIMKEGVKRGSYWTPYLSAALMCGGPYVIGVFFPEIIDEWCGEGKWQFLCRRTIKPTEFIATMRYSAKLLTYNPAADRKMRKYYCKLDGKKWCNHCNGHGETTYLDNGHGWLIGGSRFDNKVYKKPSRSGPVTPCLKCCGRGRK